MESKRLRLSWIIAELAPIIGPLSVECFMSCACCFISQCCSRCTYGWALLLVWHWPLLNKCIQEWICCIFYMQNKKKNGSDKMLDLNWIDFWSDCSIEQGPNSKFTDIHLWHKTYLCLVSLTWDPGKLHCLAHVIFYEDRPAYYDTSLSSRG